MEILSLARKTDIIFAKLSSEIIDRGNYMVIKTPQSPNFHWGNYLIFESPPKQGDLKKWKSLFHKEFQYYSVDDPNHYLFTWNNQKENVGEIRDFLDAGYELDKGVVLTATKVVKPKKHNESIIVKKILSESDWEKANHNRALVGDEKYFSSFEASLQFTNERMDEFRSVTKNKSGDWFGAFMGNQLVGGLGIYFEDQLGRFQMVSTHPEYQRQGVCSTLVYEAAKMALTEYKLETLVMEADAGYHAAKIYESVGFKPSETDYALSWWKTT